MTLAWQPADRTYVQQVGKLYYLVCMDCGSKIAASPDLTLLSAVKVSHRCEDPPNELIKPVPAT